MTYIWLNKPQKLLPMKTKFMSYLLQLINRRLLLDFCVTNNISFDNVPENQSSKASSIDFTDDDIENFISAIEYVANSTEFKRTRAMILKYQIKFLYLETRKNMFVNELKYCNQKDNETLQIQLSTCVERMKKIESIISSFYNVQIGIMCLAVVNFPHMLPDFEVLLFKMTEFVAMQNKKIREGRDKNPDVPAVVKIFYTFCKNEYRKAREQCFVTETGDTDDRINYINRNLRYLLNDVE